jgi:hypothetical protein
MPQTKLEIEQAKTIIYLREALQERAPLANAYDNLLKQYQGLLVKNVEYQEHIRQLEVYIAWTGENGHPMRTGKLV